MLYTYCFFIFIKISTRLLEIYESASRKIRYFNQRDFIHVLVTSGLFPTIKNYQKPY